MAKLLKEMPPNKPRSTKYPWDEWMDGQPRLLTRGTDYHCTHQTLRVMASTQAARRHGHIVTRTVSDTAIVIKFVE